MLKSQSILEKMHPEDTNMFASNIIDKYENRPDDLHSLCLADLHIIMSAKNQVMCQ